MRAGWRRDGPARTVETGRRGWPRIWWNLNIQIAYSPVYAANRSELGESFTRFIDARRAAFISNAKKIWGFDQCATVPHTTSYDGTNGDGFCCETLGPIHQSRRLHLGTLALLAAVPLLDGRIAGDRPDRSRVLSAAQGERESLPAFAQAGRRRETSPAQDAFARIWRGSGQQLQTCRSCAGVARRCCRSTSGIT